MIKDETYKRYEGDTLKQPSPVISYRPKVYKGKVRKGQKAIRETIAPYFPSEELKQAVEYARLLNRPLLLRGEPGCGKTRLAQAVAYELYGANYRERYFEWHIKSTTKAQHGLYEYDAVSRLRDSQLGDERVADIALCERPRLRYPVGVDAWVSALSAGPLTQATDEAGFTPLMLAAELGLLPVVKLLLTHGADPHVEIGDHGALAAARRNRHAQVVALLRQVGVR